MISNDTYTNADNFRIVYAQDLLLKITVTLLNPYSSNVCSSKVELSLLKGGSLKSIFLI